MSLTSSSLSKSASVQSGEGSSEKETLSSSQEFHEEDDHFPEVPKLKPKKGDYYFQEYKYVKPTRRDYERKELKGTKLFPKEKIHSVDLEKEASILVTGFGMRNLESFQRILKMTDEQRRKRELEKLWRDQKEKLSQAAEEEGVASASTSTELTWHKSTSELTTQTETSTISVDTDQKKQLDYLLGLETEIEELDQFDIETFEPEEGVEFAYSTSKSMKEAQKYLRIHRIFEFFQFIAAHMLSAKANNPVESMLKLLNQCLLYRSGMGEAPLLYDRRHIEQLFFLMDRMRCGYIDLEQYKTGIRTLGIGTFNENPITNEDGMVSKEIFIEETYDAELDLFNDLIKSIPSKKPKAPRSIVTITSASSSSDRGFSIPPELLMAKARQDKIDYEMIEG